MISNSYKFIEAYIQFHVLSDNWYSGQKSETRHWWVGPEHLDE